MTTRALLRATGLLVWIFAGVPVARIVLGTPLADGPGFVLWVSAFVVFGAAFFAASRSDAPAWRLVLVQSCLALAMNVILCTGFELALLVVVAVELGLFPLPRRLAVGWLAAQIGLASLLAIQHMGLHAGSRWSIVVAGAQSFGFVVAAMAGREAASRRELEKANAALEATRDSLACASRDAERLRIARELHDVLGHDLVAIHLELETARHLATGKAAEPVERAHAIGKRLLADVRDTVSHLREVEPPAMVDVARDVRAIVDHVKTPRVHLDLPATLGVDDVDRANAIVRFVQEAVTNAIKHAGAANLWIAIVPNDVGVELTARDDGHGSDSPTPGNGLAGMRERVERLGGELSLEGRPGVGFFVRALLPARGQS